MQQRCQSPKNQQVFLLPPFPVEAVVRESRPDENAASTEDAPGTLDSATPQAARRMHEATISIVRRSSSVDGKFLSSYYGHEDGTSAPAGTASTPRASFDLASS
jgi:hypothetical protein